jgi:hypothetical protein
MSLTVVCVWVDGHVPYTPDYVVKLRAMCRRWIRRPFRFVCLTDRPHKLPQDFETIRINYDKKLKGWWAKVALFDKRTEFIGRVLYLDLDTLVFDPLDEIIDYPAQFALAPHAGDFNGKDGLAVVKRFNSSVMVWDAGTQNHLFENFCFDLSIPKRLWGDQDWIGEQCPHAAAMPTEWFPRMSEFAWPNVPKAAKVILCKKPKNTLASKLLTGFAEAWG